MAQLCRLPGFVVAMILTLSVTPAAFAQYGADAYMLEAFVGAYEPDPDLLDGQTTYGLRVGHVYPPGYGWQFSAGRFESDTFRAVVGDVTILGDYDAMLLDFVLQYYFAHSSRISPVVFAGPGWASVSADIRTDPIGVGGPYLELNEDSLTVNAGLGLEIEFGEQLYVTPAVRWRWFEARNGNDLDLEGTVALGLKF